MHPAKEGFQGFGRGFTRLMKVFCLTSGEGERNNPEIVTRRGKKGKEASARKTFSRGEWEAHLKEKRSNIKIFPIQKLNRQERVRKGTPKRRTVTSTRGER